MFLRSKTRKKDGKEHRYWSVVENRRVADGRVVQRQVLYLGEINDAQRAAWCRSIAVFDEDARRRDAAGPVPGGPRGPGVGLCGGPGQAERTAAAPPAAVGGLLAGVRAVGPAAAGHLLAAATAAQPQGHALAECPQDAGGLPSDRPRQRVAPAPPVVRPQRHGRPARRGLCHRPEPHPLSLSGPSGGAQAGAVLLPAGALAHPLRCPLRGPALRSDQHLFRVRSARARQAQASATAATSAPTASRWSSP